MVLVCLVLIQTLQNVIYRMMKSPTLKPVYYVNEEFPGGRSESWSQEVVSEVDDRHSSEPLAIESSSSKKSSQTSSNTSPTPLRSSTWAIAAWIVINFGFGELNPVPWLTKVTVSQPIASRATGPNHLTRYVCSVSFQTH